MTKNSARCNSFQALKILLGRMKLIFGAIIPHYMVTTFKLQSYMYLFRKLLKYVPIWFFKRPLLLTVPPHIPHLTLLAHPSSFNIPVLVSPLSLYNTAFYFHFLKRLLSFSQWSLTSYLTCVATLNEN